MNAETTLARRLRLSVIGAVAVLIAILIAWRALNGLSTGDVILIVVLTLPFGFAIPRLMAGNRRAYAWMTLAVTPFLVVAITEAVANPSTRLWSGSCLTMAFGLFVLLIAYLRVTRGAVPEQP
ncbi:DUF2069 domain-containing protein [Steroidobacter sp.]|uniref:DUF2069 domain-containing protein n=1 Tax=Steroidobacter sp. TaxID=1978227 RepID=UPI001A3B546C|nr:DUF2069 domain-containing protein [Steroidobacter sp.]MBL8270803.1 DUF2069 domain-containing protein [Steroidobacter sp.]